MNTAYAGTLEGVVKTPSVPGIDITPQTFRLPRGFLIIFLSFLLSFALGQGAPGFMSVIFGEFEWLAIATDSIKLVFLALIIPVFLKQDKITMNDLGFIQKFRIYDLVWGILAGFVIYYFHDTSLAYIASVSGIGDDINRGAIYVAEKANFDSPKLTILSFLVGSSLMPGIIEEILYRGCAISSMRAVWGSDKFNMIVYVAVSSGIFAFVHSLGHQYYYFSYFATGVMLACVYLGFRSLNASMIAHMTINAIPFIKLYIVNPCFRSLLWQ
ncbi:CPBP family intramembrane glutamic endopeptidase [Elusimicrobiota bacterium]